MPGRPGASTIVVSPAVRKNARSTTRSPGRGRADKSADKKQDLLRHALAALAEVGFSRINLRDVAARSNVSLGVIHYYFADKHDLLISCVSLYKEEFIARLERAIDIATEADTLPALMIDILVHSAENDAQTHRLWYDTRTQALFDPIFQPLVEDIECRLITVIRRFLDKMQALGDGVCEVAQDALGIYLMLDGCFRYFLQQRLSNVQVAAAMRERLNGELKRILIRHSPS